MEPKTSRSENGLLLVEAGEFTFVLVIPSRRRIPLLSQSPLLPVANVFVAESEEDDYRAAFEGVVGSVQTHREYGMSRITNFMLEVGWATGADVVLRMDDDVHGFIPNLVMSPQAPIVDLRTCLDVIASVLGFARELGTAVISVQASPKWFFKNALDPFLLRSLLVGGFLGFTDPALRGHDDLLTHEDDDLSLLSMVRTGMSVLDLRFRYINNGDYTASRADGCSALRSSHQEVADLEALERHWSPYVEVLWDKRRDRGMIPVKVHIP